MKKILYLYVIGIFIFLTSCKNVATAQQITVISPQEVHNAVFKAHEIQLVDVRTKEEYDAGHLKNAQNICVTEEDFEQNVTKLDREQPIYVYCKSGKRSAKAAQILKEMGFNEIYDMEGGIVNWESQDLNLEAKN